jgi:hypothetical protein
LGTGARRVTPLPSFALQANPGEHYKRNLYNYTNQYFLSMKVGRKV